MKILNRLVALQIIMLLYAGAAHAALAIIVHPSNSMTGISAEEAADIYLGKVGVFPDGKRVMPVDQASNSLVRQKFYRSVVKKEGSTLKVYWSKLLFTGKAIPPREVGDDADVKGWVAANPDAIGYVDGKFVDSTVKVLLIIP